MTQQGLLWQLFLMVRELMPPTQENTKRQTEWAAWFHDLPAEPESSSAEVSDEQDDHPRAHAARQQPKRRR